MSESDEEYETSTQDEKKWVKEAVKAILVLDYSKKPFKQSDILKFLSKKPNRKELNNVIEMSKKKLKEMGLVLVDTKNTKSKSFILVSEDYPLSSIHRFANENEVADRTLLILVLTYIFMKEGSVFDVDVFNHLKELKIYNEERPIHQYFGDVKKKILNKFTSQLYLEKVATDNESETFEIKWGSRAVAEVSKKSILDFVCKIGYEGTIQPRNLASHYHAAMEEEKSMDDNDEDDDVMIIDS